MGREGAVSVVDRRRGVRNRLEREDAVALLRVRCRRSWRIDCRRESRLHRLRLLRRTLRRCVEVRPPLQKVMMVDEVKLEDAGVACLGTRSLRRGRRGRPTHADGGSQSATAVPFIICGRRVIQCFH